MSDATGWRKSRASSSNEQCVEVACAHGAQFRSANASNSFSNCVEAAHIIGEVLVRDSKNPDGPHLHFAAHQWDGGRGVEFTPAGVGEIPSPVLETALSRGHDMSQQWYSVTDGTDKLWFDQGEVDAFRSGVRAQEFTLA